MPIISRDPTKQFTWRLEPGKDRADQVYLRDVQWTTCRAKGTLMEQNTGHRPWRKLFWKMGGFIDAETRRILTKSSYARFDPDGSAWYC